MHRDPSLAERTAAVESFIRRQQDAGNPALRQMSQGVIKIPVVVHVLYHEPSQNISNEAVRLQIEMLNKCFRRQNADTVNTPIAFRPVAADCEIEFELAISDPWRRATTGINRKYTPVKIWETDDKMKFASEMGIDAWDPTSYLNIWVCNLRTRGGYSSLPGSAPDKDGIVISVASFGNSRIAVHEAGHWMGLRHIWGDASCGDDLVDDTPVQGAYTPGCPSGIRSSCNNGPAGDMYMNYMDFTMDACINLFTKGQKMRMRAVFDEGGVREPILSSRAFDRPLIQEIPLPEKDPDWLYANFYPNPGRDKLWVDVSFDERWIGKEIAFYNLQGQQVLQVRIETKVQVIDISRLAPGIYFASGKRADGAIIRQKFVKQ